jgi:polyisoprenyl-phosphate glycosyltransferase
MKLDIAIPIHNESKNIQPLITRLAETLIKTPNISYRIIFIDDMSSDNSLEIINNLIPTNPHIGYISTQKQYGHQSALNLALDHTTAEAVVTLDGDLQHPPELIPTLVTAYSNGANVAQAARTNFSLSLKDLSSFLFYKIFNLLFKNQIIPFAADFRLIDKKTNTLFKNIKKTNKILRAQIPSFNLKIATITYQQQKRNAGKPAYNLKQDISLTLKILSNTNSIIGNFLEKILTTNIETPQIKHKKLPTQFKNTPLYT